MAKTSKPMSIIDHLNELRRRLMTVVIVVVIATIVSFFYSGPILELLTRGITLIYIRPAEAMMAHIRLAATSGVMLSTPVIFYQIIAFMMPALTKKEKRILMAAVILMFFLFACGVSFAWFIVYPFALDFFGSFASEQLLPWYTISDYVSFSTGFMLSFGFVFQLPLLFWVLGALGVVSSKFLRASRKYALVVIVILSAFITPPDVVSQILMVFPMMALYEFGIWLVMLTEISRRKRAAAEDKW